MYTNKIIGFYFISNKGGLNLYNSANIIDKIKQIAKQNGVTLTHLCKSVGKRATFLGEVKLGKDSLDDNELAIIAAELHTTPEYLRGETDDPAPSDDYLREIEKSPLKRDFMKQVASMSDSDILAIANLLKQFKGE